MFERIAKGGKKIIHEHPQKVDFTILKIKGLNDDIR